MGPNRHHRARSTTCTQEGHHEAGLIDPVDMTASHHHWARSTTCTQEGKCEAGPINPVNTTASHHHQACSTTCTQEGKCEAGPIEPLMTTCCYARFTLSLYYLPYLGIELPTSLRYRSLLIATLLILRIVPGLDSRTASCSPHGKPFTMHIAQPCI